MLRMRGVFYCRSEMSAPWALEMSAFEDCASCHVVVSGEAVFDVPPADENPIRLAPGDLAVVPHGGRACDPQRTGAAACGAVDRSGWLLALRDPHIGRALAAVHRAPEHPWTVASLAREAAMSRSAFAAHFTDLVGEPAMQYVTRWRMESALTALREGASVAARSGYESEAAFARAFKRVTGLTPGSARRAVPNATTPR
jgi:AraC-like DNA-binding protein